MKECGQLRPFGDLWILPFPYRITVNCDRETRGNPNEYISGTRHHVKKEKNEKHIKKKKENAANQAKEKKKKNRSSEIVNINSTVKQFQPKCK